MSILWRGFVLAALLGWSVEVEAEVLLYDEFDYPDGSLITVSDGAWSNHSGISGQLQALGGRVELRESSSGGEDVNCLLAGQPYSAGSPLILYVGFTVRFSDLPGGGEQYFVHLKHSGTTSFRAKVFATTRDASSGSCRLGIAEGASTGAEYLARDLNLLTDYRVVVRYDLSSAASTLWVDPNSESDPSARATDSAGPLEIVALALRQSSSIGVLEIDDVVVATSFEEVVNGTLLPPAPFVPAFSLLNYNMHGNHVEDWSTNSPQVKAIGRQVELLDPDIITFQEIPLSNTWQMTNFVASFRPGFHLAANSGTDGFIRSAILSRFPITRSQSWLDGTDLRVFGYTNANPYLDNFTRDLFEAEVMVPGFLEPLHVFTAHLKSGQGGDDSSRRAAEAGAISNFLVNAFLPTKGHRPFVLTGDMNEDIARPPISHPQTLQTLTSLPTRLQLTTPRNPYNDSELTISTRSGMYARYDYILPGGLLFSNIVRSEVFRSDLLPGPPAPLLGSDSATASDHLPVLMVFSNPYDLPFRLWPVAVKNGMASLTWDSTPGWIYDIESSSRLDAWVMVATNLVAAGTNLTHILPATNEAQYYRVIRHQP